MESNLIPKTRLTEIVSQRDAAVRMFDEAWDALVEADAKLGAAKAMLNLACGGHSGHFDHDRAAELDRFFATINLPEVREWKRTARRLADTKVWLSIIDRTNLEALMDRTAKDELRAQMRWVPEKATRDGELINEEEIARSVPPVTVEAIEASLRGFAEDADTIWRRGIAVAFSKLERRFRSHDGFSIGSRVILTYVFDSAFGGWNWGSHHRDTLIDIERVFLVMDGRPTETIGGSIVQAVDNHFRENGRGRQFTVEGDYFRVRGFKNGNAHLWFTRDDLVEKVNRELAAYYGETLGTGKGDPDAPESPQEFMAAARAMGPARAFGFYPTPKAAAQQVWNTVRLYGRERLKILEPSAGTGNLISPEMVENHRVTAFEIQPELCSQMQTRWGSAVDIRCRDFLKQNPEEHDAYDLIVMNPPFDRRRDVAHILHAWRFLKPGGQLVAICSAGTEFREDRWTSQLRKIASDNRGEWFDLPAGSFSDVGTNVNTRVLNLWKRES